MHYVKSELLSSASNVHFPHCLLSSLPFRSKRFLLAETMLQSLTLRSKVVARVIPLMRRRLEVAG